MHTYKPWAIAMMTLMTTLFLIPTTETHAQNTGLYVSFEGGPAFPMGAYSAQSGDQAGYAEMGLNGTAGVGFRLTEFLALGARFAFTQNPVHPDASFLEETPWKSNFFMADVTADVPVGSRFAIEGNVSAGYNQTTFPDGNFSLGNIEISNDGGKGSGFGYGAGLGIRYFMDDYVSFRLGANYLGTNPDLESGNESIDQPINLLTTNFGITLTMD